MKHIKIIRIKRCIIKILILPTLIVLLFTGCEKQENYKYIHNNPGGRIGKTALAFIQQTDSLSLMEEAISATGMQDLYSGAHDYTYIIPINEAFRKYMKANHYLGVSDIPVPLLKNVLLYHIVKAKVLFSDTALQSDNPIPYETGNGQIMYLSRNNNYQGVINAGTNKSWTIRTSNIEPVNGVIHISPDIVYFSAKTSATSIPNASITSDTIYAIQDTYINGGAKSASNFGNDPLIKVKDVDGGGDYDRRSFLMFDLKDIEAKGKLRKASIEVGVNFTHGKGLRLSIFGVPDTTWSEMTMNWNNAPAANTNEIAHIVTSKVSEFKWDCTEFVASNLKDPQKVSVMIDGEPGGNETNDLISKENPKMNPPRLITTFSSGNSQLAMGINAGLTVSNGSFEVLTNKMLEMKGAAHKDIIYALESAPSKGWLVMGSTILEAGSKFTQLDIDVKNIVYVHSGIDNSDDSFSLSVSDPDGGNIDPFAFRIVVK